MHLLLAGESAGRLDNIAGSVLIPFPDPGPWYIALAVACYNQDSNR